MVIVKHAPAACLVALVCLSLRADTLPNYKAGDTAPQDIVAAVPFDVVDAQATASLKASQAQGIAAIYHQYEGQTNVVAKNFLAIFAQAHDSFSNAVAAAYHQPSIDNSTIEASDFGYLVTAFNVEHKAFPVSTELAVTWARGGSGAALRDKWLGMLLQAMNGPLQPDKVPVHFVFRKKVRIMPLTNANETFTFTKAWRVGHIISLDKIPEISVARAKFRRQFSEEQQPLAGALAQFLEPNCFPDVAITKQARDYSVRQIVVSVHFDAGQVIVRRGTRIDAQELAALAAMNQAMMPGALNQQIAAEHERAQQEHELAQAEQQQAQVAQQAELLAQKQQQQAQADRARAQSQAEQERQQAAAMREQALEAQQQAQRARIRDTWLLATLVPVSILAIAVWLYRQRQGGSSTMKLRRVESSPASAVELAPYLAQTLKDAVVQGLAAQRAELLEAQRLAAAEITELVHRLDVLQAPMQERMRAYQERIQELQKELAERTEENRELLKMKIEMMRRQIETERGRVRFN
ncbi:MAG TPA: hypothetical protein VGY56_15460 [Verrucomicrobiae bacterium]|nr:hypothetical protein [Verrucomicrobiae bacterium]